MRICVSGTSCQGKTTFINDFLEEWGNYVTPEKTYRDVLKRDSLPHSQQTNKETQWAILNDMIDSHQKYSRDDYVIFDRCPIDNIIYSIWACAKKDTDIDEKFIQKCIPLVKETCKLLDIMFVTPITRVAPIEIEENGIRDTDPLYIEEIDHLFKAVKRDWDENPESKFWDKDDKPAMIEIFGAPHERIQIAKMYLDADGDCMGESDSPLVTEEEIREAEKYKYKFGISDEQTRAFNKPSGKPDKYE